MKHKDEIGDKRCCKNCEYCETCIYETYNVYGRWEQDSHTIYDCLRELKVRIIELENCL